MRKIKNIIELLESVKKHPTIYLGNTTSDGLFCFLNGFHACLIALTEHNDGDFANNKKSVLILRGWQVPSVLINKEMERKGFSEIEIIQELLTIEIETWRILEKNDGILSRM